MQKGIDLHEFAAQFAAQFAVHGTASAQMQNGSRIYFQVDTQSKYPLKSELFEYLDDKFITYHLLPTPQYDDGKPRRGRKKEGKYQMTLALMKISSRMVREVILPGLKDIARKHKCRVRLSGYIPKRKAMLSRVKVLVY